MYRLAIRKLKKELQSEREIHHWMEGVYPGVASRLLYGNFNQDYHAWYDSSGIRRVTSRSKWKV